MKRFVAIVLTAMMIGAACSAMAAYTKPRSYVTPATTTTSIYGLTSQRLFLNSGPGTRRFFKELGSFGSSEGEYVRILAKAWDPNNSIWWVKVEYPTGSGSTGWTGYKRFYASSFDLNSVPAEEWY